MVRNASRLLADLEARAVKLGFDAFGVAPAAARPDLPAKLNSALARGWHGGMVWMEETARRRGAPEALWPGVRSVLMFGINYGPAIDPMSWLGQETIGNLSVYARNRDYHGLIKGRLKEIAGLLARRTGAGVKVFVDTAPLMEKPLAEAAGIGWQGKHTVLVSRQFGAWLFLGAILTSAELPASLPQAQACGTCTKCLDICPTNAFPAPFRLDARKCLAYLNVEHKGQIPRPYRAPMGNRVFGCDDCLAVCPWNKFASLTKEAQLLARDELQAPSLEMLVRLDDQGFRKLFAGSPVKRLGHTRFLRNVLIAIGNSRSPELAGHAQERLTDESPLVRGAAVWAVRRLLTKNKAAALQSRYLPFEHDHRVAAEWFGPLTPPFSEADPS